MKSEIIKEGDRERERERFYSLWFLIFLKFNFKFNKNEYFISECLELFI